MKWPFHDDAQDLCKDSERINNLIIISIHLQTPGTYLGKDFNNITPGRVRQEVVHDRQPIVDRRIVPERIDQVRLRYRDRDEIERGRIVANVVGREARHQLRNRRTGKRCAHDMARRFVRQSHIEQVHEQVRLEHQHVVVAVQRKRGLHQLRLLPRYARHDAVYDAPVMQDRYRVRKVYVEDGLRSGPTVRRWCLLLPLLHRLVQVVVADEQHPRLVAHDDEIERRVVYAQRHGIVLVDVLTAGGRNFRQIQRNVQHRFGGQIVVKLKRGQSRLQPFGRFALLARCIVLLLEDGACRRFEMNHVLVVYQEQKFVLIVLLEGGQLAPEERCHHLPVALDLEQQMGLCRVLLGAHLHQIRARFRKPVP
uniref:Uncharacterized protein n=1 Tax=Anopheles melas TaxID=34690 RepID=A0A182UGN3_9DIPT